MLNFILKKKDGFKENTSVFSIIEPGIGQWLLISIFQFILYNLLIIYKEKKLFSKCFKFLIKLIKSIRNKKQTKKDNNDDLIKIDENVKQETERIKNLDLKSSTEPLLVNELIKEFYQKNREKLNAVNNLSLGVSSNECFGLLGLNGAGKTTFIKILTGELKPTSGNAYINGYNVVKEELKARLNLGYCPQFDYLSENMTVEETLTLFANLRGLDSKKINKIVQDFIQIFNLNEFKKQFIDKLSGGNKRKVSAAIGFIGMPSLVILDEPTCGMDPVARRYLWSVIKRCVDLGTTVLLTTHSMDECEALSSRLGFMVNGQFKYLGNTFDLKQKYGTGYTLILKCINNNQINELEQFIIENINYSKLIGNI